MIKMIMIRINVMITRTIKTKIIITRIMTVMIITRIMIMILMRE